MKRFEKIPITTNYKGDTKLYRATSRFNRVCSAFARGKKRERVCTFSTLVANRTGKKCRSIVPIKTSAIAQKNRAFDDYRPWCTYIGLVILSQRILPPYIRGTRSLKNLIRRVARCKSTTLDLATVSASSTNSKVAQIN